MLRKTYILTALLSLAAAAATAQEPADTLMRATDVDVVITESAAGLRIDATGDDIELTHTERYPDNATIHSTQSRLRIPSARLAGNSRVSWDLVSSTLMFGFSGTTGAPEALDLEMGKSLEIDWLNVLALRCDIRAIRSSVSVGIGFGWRNYRTTTGMRLVQPDGGAISYTPFADDVTPKYSRLKVFSLSVPVFYTFRFSLPRIKHLGLQFGPIVNFNTHASIENRWLDADGRKQTQSIKAPGQRRVSVDLYAALRFCDAVGIYVRYSPQSVLLHSPAVDFKPLSTGFVVGF